MPLLPIWESRTQSCAGALNRRTPPKMGFPTWLPVYPFHRFDRPKDLASGIENGPVEIVDLPSYKMVMFHRYVNVYQRVNNPNHTSSGNIPLVMCTRCLQTHDLGDDCGSDSSQTWMVIICAIVKTWYVYGLWSSHCIWNFLCWSLWLSLF